jgi:Family of unknown function (DUF6030)
MRSITVMLVILIGTVSVQAAGEFFGQPQKLCSALASDGLSTEGWKVSRDLPGDWYCMTPLTRFGSIGTSGLDNNIAFYVNGTSPSRAHEIRIKININNPAERKAAFTRLERATKTLLKAVGEPVPAELAKALSQQKPVSLNANYGRVELVLVPQRIYDSFIVVLTDAKHLAEKDQARRSSAGDFEACKAVVAKSVGYSASLLSGDGVPLQEAGYKSFTLSGRGKDLFVCEVHPDRRYKVKASLNGKFPFKYIAEGQF